MLLSISVNSRTVPKEFSSCSLNNAAKGFAGIKEKKPYCNRRLSPLRHFNGQLIPPLLSSTRYLSLMMLMGYCTYQTQACNRNSTRSSSVHMHFSISYYLSNSLSSFKWKIVYEIFECSTQQRGPRPTTKQQMWRQRPASQQRWRNRLPTSHRGWPMLRTHFHFRSTTSLCGFFFVRSMPSGPLSLLRGLQTSARWLSPLAVGLLYCMYSVKVR